ncbi:WD repeat-containing protein 19 isoform X2 [Trypanosoma rangeli]|uniref:WD repeat-containing protein 19 isoform X2 n=1 Tax=Trypanosoma rangeli TaxID=5698 RepID=A0A3R7NKR0_TRYRA|nr:WD repeat-containing protein 19 isoform X2 [Trypanosoma rangeli]RNF04083.1 WD repeat-containing protein 19 isoform X2 [Trypanosoma rangeli]|eukprot:RNF04083.1 WD repeat-containing protein 19 isoform X2 [Trypanosoma rangeli]
MQKRFELSPKELGNGTPIFAWDSNGSCLAVYGANGKLRILSPDGKNLITSSLPGVIRIAWDHSSDTLALIQRDNSNITLQGVGKRSSDSVDSGLLELCFLAWSHLGSHLAVGNAKGALVVINSETRKKLPIVGTHTNKIIDGKWSMNNLLVLIGDDNILSISNADGVLQEQVSLKLAPVSLTLVELMQQDEEQPLLNVVALVSFGKTLELYNLAKCNSQSVSFETKLGSVSACNAIPGGMACVGFSSGAVALVDFSSQGVKVCAVTRLFQDSVNGLAFCEISGMCVAISEHVFKFFNLVGNKITENKIEGVELGGMNSTIRAVEWSKDGCNIALSMEKGQLVSYRLNVSAVSCSSGACIYFLSSPRVVTAKSLQDGQILYTANVKLDPTIIAASKGVLAVCTGNKAIFYTVEGKDVTLLRGVEFHSVVTALKVSSEHAAPLCGGKIELHEIRPGGRSVTLPENGAANIISVDMSDTLLIYATMEKICVINLNDFQCVVEHAPSIGIKKAVSNSSCTRVALIGKNDTLYIFNPVTLTLTQTEGFETEHTNILWDQGDYSVLVSYDTKTMVTFVYSPHTRYGPTCESVVVKDTNTENIITPVPGGYTPVSLFKGKVTFQASSGSLNVTHLKSHQQAMTRTPNPEAFYTNFSLNHLRWASQNISTPQEAEDLAVKALHMLDIELAIRLYRQLSQPSLVLCLENVKHINEKNLLIGHVSMIMGFFKDAQSFFLRSSQPLCALQMRHDLMQWDSALALARQMAPDKVPILSKEYAQQLEYRGEYAKALEMYRAGERTMPKGHASTELTASHEEVRNHNAVCAQGAARCLLRTGNVREGVKLALDSNDTTLIRECADILESTRQFEEAADLYERSSDFEHAATLYITEAKNLSAASRVIPKISSRNIIGMFAKAKEAEGAFKEAEQAYTQAEDWDNVVRVKVEKLNDLYGAYVVVRQSRSAAAAAVVANMCKKKGEFSSAVEFFVLAKSFSEAFELAKEKNCMSTLESALLNQVQVTDGIAPAESQGEFAMIAQYYEQSGKTGQAGLFYHIAGNFRLALGNYLEAGEPEDIEKAIQVVGKSRNDTLTNRLIDYLMGEVDGEPKDPSYIFKVYMALGSYEKAAKTSVLIATKEQEMGHYMTAHKTLVDAYSILKGKNMHVPNDLRRSLMLLHSYIIAKLLMKVMKDDETASRMLLRVVRNINKFPKHIAAIYTSTALQCVKSGFKKSAFDNACIIIQNEKYRTELDEKTRKKIEGIVRRRGKEEMEDPPEKTSPCPFCDAQVPETELDCGACKNTLPFCIVTGKHMVKDNYSECPICHFPALYSSFIALLRSSQTCPMCENIIDQNKVQKQSDPDLKGFLA